MAVLAMEQAREVSQEASNRTAFELVVSNLKLLLSPVCSRLLVQDTQVTATRYFESEDMSLSCHFGLDSGSALVSMLELALRSSVKGTKYAYAGTVQCSSQVALWLLYVCSWKLMVSQDESNGQSGRASKNVDRYGTSLLKSSGEEEHKERCEANTPHGIQEPSTEVVHKDLTGMLLSAAKEEAGDAKKDVVSEGEPTEDQQDEEDDNDDDNDNDEGQNGEDEDAGDKNGDNNNGNNDNNEGEEEGEEEDYAEDEEDEDDDDEAEAARGRRRKINVNTKATAVDDTEDDEDDEVEAEPEPPKKRVKN